MKLSLLLALVLLTSPLLCALAQDDTCKDGSCAPREMNLPHDEEENPNHPSNIVLHEITKGGFGTIIAFDDKQRQQRLLTSGRFAVGGNYVREKHEHAFPAHAIIEAVKFAWPHKPESALILGSAGAGNVYHFLRRAGVENINIVEQNYQVAQVAKKHFDLEQAASKYEFANPRTWIDTKLDKDGDIEFDLIVHDVFSLGLRPVDSLTRIAIKKLEGALSEDGILVVKWYGHLHGPHRHYSMSLFKTLKAVFPHVRLFADRANSWATQRPFAHLVFFASRKPIEFKLPEKVLKAEDAPKGKKLFTWKNFQDWEQKFSESELSSVPLITDKENVLFKWYKKIARDWKADNRYKLPLRVWNLAEDYLKISKDNPYEDDDDDDDFDAKLDADYSGNPNLKNVPPHILKQLQEMGAGVN